MTYLSTADWIVIAGYLLAMIALGVRLGHGQKTTRDYFLGGRNLPWWGVSLSIVATETSALTFIGVPAMAFGGDLTFIQIIVGYVLARVVLAVVMVPHYFRGEIYSPYQLFEQAFGECARRTVAVLFLLAGTLAAGVRVYVTCIPLDLMMGDALRAVFGDAVLGAIVLFVGLSLVYTCVGGLRAVVWTDAVQFCLLAGGGLYALAFLLADPAVANAGRDGAALEKLRWFNGGFSWSMPFNLWMGIVGATFQVLSSHGVDQLNVQRVLACRSIADGRRALVMSAVLILPLFLLFLLVGHFLWRYYLHHELALPLPEGQAGFRKNDYIFPIFILTELPPVMKGFLIVGILSAAMSSVSSALSALASVSTMDVFKVLRPGKSEDWYLRFSRWSTVFWAGMLVLVAYASRDVKFVLNWAFSLNGLTSGAMLGGLLLVVWWRRGGGMPVITGMLMSLAAMIAIKFGAPDIAWPWYTLIGSAVCVLVAVLARGWFSARPN